MSARLYDVTRPYVLAWLQLIVVCAPFHTSAVCVWILETVPTEPVPTPPVSSLQSTVHCSSPIGSG